MSNPNKNGANKNPHNKKFLKFYDFRGNWVVSPIPYDSTISAEEAGNQTCAAGFAATFEVVTTATLAAALAAAAAMV